MFRSLCAVGLLAFSGLAWAACLPGEVKGDDWLRLATWNADLSRKGPGMLLRDIMRGDDPDLRQLLEGVAAVDPDVLLLTRVDVDPQGAAVRGLQDLLGPGWDHALAPVQNRGLPSGADLDGDGLVGGADDAQGHGFFRGDGVMVLLSRIPLGGLVDHGDLLWRDLPGARLESVPQQVRDVQRLASSSWWQVQAGPVTLLAWAAGPPIFGKGRRNLDRNHDEAAFWLHLLDGPDAPKGPLVLTGLANADAGQGDMAALQALSAHPRLHPPLARPSADMPGGPARLSWMQASRDLCEGASGVWPQRRPDGTGDLVGRHRMLWLDVSVETNFRENDEIIPIVSNLP